MPYTYVHFHPAVAVDCVVFGLDLEEEELKILLVRRKSDPYEGRWALPGGFVREEESLEEAARRELSEESGLGEVYLEQLYTFGAPRRDPRERVISVAYFGLVQARGTSLRASTDADAAAWFPTSKLPHVAFDHAAILETALARLKGKVRYQPLGFELLPPKFTLTELQRLYEIVLGRPLDKRNFRKKVLATGLLVGLDEKEQGVAHRAAQLYRFDQREYARKSKSGYFFEI